MNKIRLLHVAQCAGGVDCYLHMLLAHMDKNRFVHILVCSSDYPRDKYENLVDQFIQIEMCNSLSFIKDVKSVRMVRGLIKCYHPDIIYCHSSKAGGIGRIANIGTGIPVVYNPHGWAFNMKGSKLKSLIYLWIEKLLSPLTTRYINISNYEKLSAIENRVDKASKMKIIFNGIDIDAVDKALESSVVTRASLNIPDEAYLIGMVGRISQQKAPDIFVRVAAVLKNILPNAYFMIVGDGDQRYEIENLIKDTGLDGRVTITGWVNNPVAYSNLFDQAVLLSRWEGFGLVLVEYMKLGKPIVATEVDAIPDLIVDHENGLLVEMDNVEQVVNAITEIINNDELKSKLTTNGMMRVKALFNVQRVADEHDSLFMKIYKHNKNSKKGY
ncbi:glycosyltransferase family 4 protein [Phocaeicola sp.]